MPWLLTACDSAQYQNSESQTPSADTTSQPQSTVVNDQQARTAFIDPVTGELTSEPSIDAMNQLEAMNQAQQRRAVTTSPMPQRLPNGAIKFDLQGHFHSPLTATIGEDGNVKLRHQPAMPMTKQQK